MKIAIVGAGYVGLTTAGCLAMLGHKVTCHDCSEDRLAALRAGRLPIYEPGLDEAFGAAMKDGALTIAGSLQDCVAQAEAAFLAVGTPSLPDGSIDLSQIKAAAADLALHIRPGTLVIVKSTVSVGTCRMLKRIMARRRGSIDFAVASNPEFLREGSAVRDFMEPDRVVIGVDDEEAADTLRAIYAPLVEAGVPLLATSTENAEMVKHAANAFLALKIGFINEVADFCERAGADVAAVAEGIGLDRRIGTAFLSAGPGFGGSCFPKDTRAFAACARSVGAPQALVETLIARNEQRKTDLAERIARQLVRGGNRVVGVLGAAFKANTDDVRESPAMAIIAALVQKGITVRAHDPKAMVNAARLIEGVEWCATPQEAAEGASALAVLTEWPQFALLDLAELRERMAGRVLFDYRNLFDAQAARAAGFIYVGIGRGDSADLEHLVPEPAVAAIA